MSRSSARERPPVDRGQVEPVAALLALAVVCAGLSLYAGVLDGALSTRGDGGGEASADPTADRVRERLAPAGVADPSRLASVADLAPAGHRLNATLACRERTWTAGPSQPTGAARATDPVSVRVAPGRVRPCGLTVVVWS